MHNTALVATYKNHTTLVEGRLDLTPIIAAKVTSLTEVTACRCLKNYIAECVVIQKLRSVNKHYTLHKISN